MNFLNAFQVMDSYIQLLTPPGPVLLNPSFTALSSFDEAEEVTKRKAVGQLLLHAWSAEYALRITPVVNDEQYLQSSLHWTFPQAYYSVLFSARAFLLVQGVNLSNEERIRKRIANLVVSGYYPKSVGYYGLGLVDSFGVHRLPPTVPVLKDFLKETRLKRMKAVFETIQLNPKTMLRSKMSGKILVKLPDASVSQLQEIVKQIGYTTYFDLMARLRISSTNRDIEKLELETIDVRDFHAALSNIVSHINGIHESYIALAIGSDAYRELVSKLPFYLQEGFVRERMQTTVMPSLDSFKPVLP